MDSSDSDDEQLLLSTIMVMTITALTHRKKRQKKRKAAAASWAAAVELDNSSSTLFEVDHAKQDDNDPPKLKRTRIVLPRPDYAKAPWSRMLRQEATSLKDHTSTEARVFLRLFRVPYVFFVELVGLVKAHKWFPIAEIDITGRPCIPVELKVLAVLHILGTGKNYFDDVRQLSYMSPPTQQAVFHKFCKHLTEELYDDHVKLPTGAALSKAMDDYHKLGFTGAVGSTDVIHIVRWDCQRYDNSPLRSSTSKDGCSTIAYRVTVDHTGRVLAVTAGIREDKTAIGYDAGVKRLREDPVYNAQEYQLRGEGGELVACKGVFLLVANGYHQYRETQEATRYPVDADENQYSKALEDVRSKDVDHFLGTLKGRFRILKLPGLNRKKESVDNFFLACCILYNMLRAYGGIDDELEAGVDWAGVDGLHDARIRSPTTDVSYIGDPGCNESLEVEPAHDELKRRLITSYAYRQKHNECYVLPHIDCTKTTGVELG